MRSLLRVVALGVFLSTTAYADDAPPVDKKDDPAPQSNTEKVRQKLRQCMEETSALMATGNGLRLQREQLEANKTDLEGKKELLAESRKLVDGWLAGPGPDYDKAVAVYNRQARDFNDSLRAMDAAIDSYAAGEGRLKKGLDEVEKHCASLEVTDDDLDAVCGTSENPFCTSYAGD